MKKLFCLFLLILSINNLKAQKSDIQHIPPYRLLTKDSTYITPANLKKNKPVMIVYFSPDCTHCQHFTLEMKEEFEKEKKSKVHTLRNTQIVMATWTQLQEIQLFYKDYELAKYPNIVVGTEGTTYLIQRYYQVKTTPYIAIYSKSGLLVKAFEKMPTIADIVATLKKA